MHPVTLTPGTERTGNGQGHENREPAAQAAQDPPPQQIDPPAPGPPHRPRTPARQPPDAADNALALHRPAPTVTERHRTQNIMV